MGRALAPTKARRRENSDVQIARYFAMGINQTPDGEFVAGNPMKCLAHGRRLGRLAPSLAKMTAPSPHSHS
jgi:hypothetical protein